jgi:hypothetical protein
LGTSTHEPADAPAGAAAKEFRTIFQPFIASSFVFPLRPLAEFMQYPLTSTEASVYLYEFWNGEF